MNGRELQSAISWIFAIAAAATKATQIQIVLVLAGSREENENEERERLSEPIYGRTVALSWLATESRR